MLCFIRTGFIGVVSENWIFFYNKNHTNLGSIIEFRNPLDYIF